MDLFVLLAATYLNIGNLLTEAQLLQNQAENTDNLVLVACTLTKIFGLPRLLSKQFLFSVFSNVNHQQVVPHKVFPETSLSRWLDHMFLEHNRLLLRLNFLD